MRLEMKCQECGSSQTRLLMTMSKKRGIVRFRVECDRHGGHSHFLKKSPYERAVEREMRQS